MTDLKSNFPDEKQSMIDLRDSVITRIKSRLYNTQTISITELQGILNLVLQETQGICQEVMNLYPQIDAYQKAGWRIRDCLEHLLPQARSQPVQNTAKNYPQQKVSDTFTPSPQNTTHQKSNELDGIAKEFEKGIKELGGALKDIFGTKKTK